MIIIYDIIHNYQMTDIFPSIPFEFLYTTGPSSVPLQVYSFNIPPEEHVPSGSINIIRAFTFRAYLTSLNEDRIYLGDVYVEP
jgi:hypothetical protein